MFRQKPLDENIIEEPTPFRTSSYAASGLEVVQQRSETGCLLSVKRR